MTSEGPFKLYNPLAVQPVLQPAGQNVFYIHRLNSLPKTVTRHRRDCDLNPGPSAPESSTLTTQLPSHPIHRLQ